MSSSKLWHLFGVAIIGVVVSGAAQAHHSTAMFDRQKTIELTGTVTAFEYTNPHSITRMKVSDGKGGFVEWVFEGVGPGMLSRLGWNRNTIKVGDKLTVFTHPLRTGKPAGIFVKAIFADGRVLHLSDSPEGNSTPNAEAVAEQAQSEAEANQRKEAAK